MADNCKKCKIVIRHWEYNVYDGYCEDCYYDVELKKMKKEREKE